MIYVRTLFRVFGVACAFVSCAEEFDTSRRPHREASVGDHVYEVLCKRLAVQENPHDVSGRSTRALCQGTGAPDPSTSVRLRTLHNNRARLVQALDATLGIDAASTGLIATDPRLAADVRTLLDHMLPLYDSGLMEKHNAVFGGWMRQLSNTPVTRSLAAQSTRQYYNQSVVQNANHEFAVPTAALPTLLRFDQLTNLGTSFDRIFGDGAPGAEVFSTWLAQVQAALVAYKPQANAPDFLYNYLLEADDTLGGGAQPLYSVLRDEDGDALSVRAHAEVTPASLQTAPFGDANIAWNNIYTRDAFGRLQSDGELLYAYQDLNQTPLAAALRQVHLWMRKLAKQTTGGSNPQNDAAQGATDAKATILDGIAWLDAVLHDGDALFDANKLAEPSNSLQAVGVASAASSLLQHEAVANALPLVQLLWEENENIIAQAIQMGSKVLRTINLNHVVDARMPPDNALFDDFAGVLQKMDEHPGLLLRIANALKDPETAKLGALFAKHMTTTDSIDYDQEDFRSNKAIGEFKTPVDRTLGDVRGNESVFQRLMYLVHDAKGLRIANNQEAFGYDDGELFEINDAALFYLRSIVGKARMTLCGRADDAILEELQAPYTGDLQYGYAYIIESMMGLSGLTPEVPTQAEVSHCDNVVDPENLEGKHVAYTYSVTPQAAARMLFTDPEKINAWSFAHATGKNPACAVGYSPASMYNPPLIDNVPFRELHGKTLFAWEKHGFNEAIKPLLEAFAVADEGAEEGNEVLFLELMDVLHKHWSTSRSDVTQNQDSTRANYAVHSGLARFEPLAALALDNPNDGNAFELVSNLLALYVDEADGKKRQAVNGLFALVKNANEDQADCADNGACLEGASAPEDPAPGALQAPVSAFDPLDSLRMWVGHLDQQRPGTAGVFSAFLDTFSELDETRTKLTNRETHALVASLLGYLVDHRAEAGRGLEGLSQSLASSPLLASSSALMNTYNNADPQAGRLVQALLSHMVGDEQRPALLSAASQMLHNAADSKLDMQPLAGVMAEALDYPNGALPLTLKLASATSGMDCDNALPRVLANLGRPLPHLNDSAVMNETPIDVFTDVFQQLNRLRPGDTSVLSADDHGSIIAAMSRFMQDEKRGFVRLLQLIKHRHGN